MVKNIFVVPRDFIQQMIDKQSKPNNIFGNWALISIYSLSDGLLVTPSSELILNHIGCDRMISLRFADLKPNEFEIYRKKHLSVTEATDLFNESHAKQILDFLPTIDETILFVHCAAGVSRSGAVGLFCCRYFGLDESEFRKINKFIYPNSHVLEILHKYSGLDDDYLKFWEDKLKINDKVRRIKFT